MYSYWLCSLFTKPIKGCPILKRHLKDQHFKLFTNTFSFKSCLLNFQKKFLHSKLVTNISFLNHAFLTLFLKNSFSFFVWYLPLMFNVNKLITSCHLECWWGITHFSCISVFKDQKSSLKYIEPLSQVSINGFLVQINLHRSFHFLNQLRELSKYIQFYQYR